MSPTNNITVPYVPLAEFDWSFARSGPLPWNQTVWSLIAVFTALPLWMTIELTVWIFYSLPTYKSLYFYSLLITTWGVTLHAIGFVLKDCVPSCNWIISTTIAEIGWISMVSGFSVVLYSRLHIVIPNNKRTLRLVLSMIITDALLFHIPTVIFQYGTSNKTSHEKYLPYMAPMERVQVLGFSIQEILISIIYIYATLKYLSSSLNRNTRKTTAVLILIQVIVILCDVVVIALDYAEYFTLKAVIHSFVYAFKLQLEFVILNQFTALKLAPPSNLEDTDFQHNVHDINNNNNSTNIFSSRNNTMMQHHHENINSLSYFGAGGGITTPTSTTTAAAAADGTEMGNGGNDLRYSCRSEQTIIGSPCTVVGGRGGGSEVLEDRIRCHGATIRQYVAGTTDIEDVDIERQYLGAWDDQDE